MLYGKLPFWGDSEEDFINKICTAPLKFDNDIAVTEEMKEIMKSMLQKDPASRVPLLSLIQNEYFIMDDEDLEIKIQQAQEKLLQQQKNGEEEQKVEKVYFDENLINGLSLN